MVLVAETARLTVFGNGEYDSFPERELRALTDAIERVDDSVFEISKGEEIPLDECIWGQLDDYEFEHDDESGRNPACKLWADQGFDHSVDLYHPASESLWRSRRPNARTSRSVSASSSGDTSSTAMVGRKSSSGASSSR